MTKSWSTRALQREAAPVSGRSTFASLLDAERGLLDAELNRLEAQRAQLAATADLFKALGGGWDPAQPDQTAQAARAN